MGKIKYIRQCRKAQTCEKCRAVISVGSPYYKGELFRRPPVVRCAKCGLNHYEVTTSEYVRTIGRLVEDWQEDYPVGDSTAEEIAAALEEVRDECQESLDNIPEQFQDGDVGTLLQERIDELDGVIDELENYWDWCDLLSEAYDELDEEHQKAIDEEQERLHGAAYEEFYFSFCESGKDAAEAWKDLAEEKVCDFINSALESLCY